MKGNDFKRIADYIQENGPRGPMIDMDARKIKSAPVVSDRLRVSLLELVVHRAAVSGVAVCIPGVR